MLILGGEVDWLVPEVVPEDSDRRFALEMLSKMEFPSASEEDWRYGPIDSLDFASLKLAKTAGLKELSGGRVELEAAERSDLGSFDTVIVFEAGAVVGVSGSSEISIKVGVGANRRGDLEGFELLNFALAGQPLTIEIPSGFHRILLVNRGPSAGEIGLPRVTISVGDDSTAEVVEVRNGGGTGSLSIPVTSLVVGSNSKLVYTSIQTIHQDADEFGYLTTNVGKDSELDCFHLALGGRYARLRTDCDLVGDGSVARLLAGYIGGGDQVLEFRTFQNHLARHTRSELLYKGALADSSHSIYSGMIHIEKGAVGSDAFQTNRNLVLDESAHADSVPNLDIHENDVRCSHASAVGPVEEEELYYLACRGISPAQAERIVVRGFFKELASRSGVSTVGGLLYGALEEKW